MSLLPDWRDRDSCDRFLVRLFVLIMIAFGIVLLTACAGTAVQYEGPLCGSASPATLSVADRKDRGAFDARCTHTTYNADGTVAAVDEIVISTSDSSASSVIAAQANALANLAGAVARGVAP